MIAGMYAPPSLSRTAFERLLDDLGNSVGRSLLPKAMIMGDFKSTPWGSPRTDVKGGIITEWVAVLDLRLLNDSNNSTCVRWQGESL